MIKSPRLCILVTRDPSAFSLEPYKHLHCRFQFDRARKNFTIRRFRRSGHRFLRPILAAISILPQAQALDVPESAPMGAPIVTTPKSTYATISIDGILIMHQACLFT